MRSRDLSAFTLFWSDSKYDNGRDPPRIPGWQMNVRRKSEAGWSCTQITEDQAEAILSMLENSGHPDGPWTVKQRETWASIEIQATKYNGTWEDAMQRALKADGEKLRQLTGQDHGPFDDTCRHGRPLHQDCFACMEDDAYDGAPVDLDAYNRALFLAGEAGILERPTIEELLEDWKAAMVEARDVMAR